MPKPIRETGWTAARKWITARLESDNERKARVEALLSLMRPNQRALQWGQWEANKYDNLCPECKQMTLVFDAMPSVMFD
jgi:hypothetical protein